MRRQSPPYTVDENSEPWRGKEVSCSAPMAEPGFIPFVPKSPNLFLKVLLAKEDNSVRGQTQCTFTLNLSLIIYRVKSNSVLALRGSIWVCNAGLSEEGEVAIRNVIIFLLFPERVASAKPFYAAATAADSYKPRQFPALSKTAASVLGPVRRTCCFQSHLAHKSQDTAVAPRSLPGGEAGREGAFRRKPTRPLTEPTGWKGSTHNPGAHPKPITSALCLFIWLSV